MKNIFSKNSFLVLVLFLGCVNSKKQPTSKLTSDNPIISNTKAISTLDSEQVVKLNPNSCNFGWKIKDSTAVDLKFKNVKSILANNSCLSCHSSSTSNYTRLNYISTEEILNKKGILTSGNLIDPLDLKKSILLSKLGNFGGNMPIIPDANLVIIKEWIKSIYFECLKEPEILTKETGVVENTEIKISKAKDIYKTSKSLHSISTFQVGLKAKLNLVVKITEKDASILTGESIESSTNLTTELLKTKYKINTTFNSSISNRILRIEEINKYTTFDNITFNVILIHNINIMTGINTKEQVKLTQLPSLKVSTIKSIQTTTTTTGSYLNNVATIIQTTKTLSLLDNSSVEKTRTYVINATALTYTELISNCGPMSSIILENKIRTEITITCRIDAGKTILEKKIVKSMLDGSLVDGQYSGVTVIGSSLTTSQIDGDNFNYLITPLVTDKTKRPIRSCDIAAVEAAVNAQSTTAPGIWMPQRNVSLRLADRNYVLSVLVKIFGVPVTGSVAFINNLNNIYGGNFDTYDIVRDDVTKTLIVNTTPEGYPLTAFDKTPNGSIIGAINPIRVAITTRVCEDIVKNNTYILNAIKNAVGNQNLTLTTVPFPFKADFAAVHALFYPSDPVSQNTNDALICVADSELLAIDQWRNIFLTLCITPEWQIP